MIGTRILKIDLEIAEIIEVKVSTFNIEIIYLPLCLWQVQLVVVYLDILPYTNPKPNHLVFYFVLNYKFALWMVSFSKDLDKFVSRPFATFQQTTFTRAQEDITGDSYQNWIVNTWKHYNIQTRCIKSSKMKYGSIVAKWNFAHILL